MKDLLAAQRITKSFLFKGQRLIVLEDLDLLISEHEFITIVGSSGCGKSTLLELLAGITRPDSGEILYDGQVITGRGGFLGYMPQEDLLFPWLSSIQNVLLPVRIKHGDYSSAKAKALELLPVFGLENHSDQLPFQLSGGLKQRAAFLRTYMTNSRLLLLDEPFANLDAITRLRMQDWLKEIKSKLDLTILMVTHDIHEAIRLSDRILVMDKAPGRFIREFSLDRNASPDPAGDLAIYDQIIAIL